MTMVITTLMTTAMIISTTNIASMTIITAIPMLMKTNKPPGRRRSVVTEAAGSSEAPASGPADMSESEVASLYRLMTWLSPSFPVGAFSYSSGIEWAVEAVDITDATSLRRWLTSMLTDGAGICDGIFLAHVYRAASSGDDALLADLAELASAFVPSREPRGITRCWIGLLPLARPPSSIRLQLVLSAPRMLFRSRRRFTPSCMR
jgi:urease accessory protein